MPLNVMSVIAPFVGLLVGALVFVLCDYLGWSWPRSLEASFYTLDGFAGLGLILAITSLVRGEKWWGIGVLGLVLNGGVLAIFLRG